MGSRYVEIEVLFCATAKNINNSQNFLAKFGLNYEVLKGTAIWVVEERDYLAGVYFWQEDYIPPPIGGINRAMTGRVTHALDAVSEDFTKMAALGYLDKVVGKKKAIDLAIDALSKGTTNNVLVLGEPGCGKTTMIKGIAREIVFGTQNESLRFKRLVSLQASSLVAGARTPGEVSKRLEEVIADIKGAGNIIVFVDEIQNLVSSTGTDTADTASLFSFLEPHLAAGEFQFIGAATFPNYRKYIEPNGAFTRLFTNVILEEASQEDTLEVLRVLVKKFKKMYGVSVSYPALVKIVELSGRLIRDRVLPDKAVDVLERCCVAESRGGGKGFVTTGVVARVISDITKVPVSEVSSDESAKLLNIENIMKKRVVGQDDAISQIGDALRRARAGVRDDRRPIASFLFVGSTGVGKTETAKALAESYFGKEDVMIRVDMSEYQKDDSIDKLIGTSDGKTIGLLTDAVRRAPFSLVLLDEIEKASPKVLLVFLQVLDDGRLTDSTGRIIDFTNSIIIATSNVGTSKIQDVVMMKGSFEEMKKAAIEEVREKFAPEFLNRFTGIITFKPLYPSEVKEIARILLARVAKSLEAKGIKIRFKEALINKLAHDGFDPQWGARPLRRLIESTVESHVARKILAHELVRGDDVEVGDEVFGK